MIVFNLRQRDLLQLKIENGNLPLEGNNTYKYDNNGIAQQAKTIQNKTKHTLVSNNAIHFESSKTKLEYNYFSGILIRRCHCTEINDAFECCIILK